MTGHFKRLMLFLLFVFIMPALASAGWWAVQNRPASWSEADWSSSGLLPNPLVDRQAAVYVLAARTGGMKGAFSLHSWIVVKRAGGAAYDRYDKVGWGRPVRRNAFAADGRWYSNTPFFVKEIHGQRAEQLIPAIDAAIAAYPHAGHGDYHAWPGPNSNSFVAHVARMVPELDAVLPSNAVGRDFRPGLIAFDHAPDWSDVHLSIGGFAGLAIGRKSGFEMQFLGLVAGVDFINHAIKVPGFGQFRLF